MTCQANISTDSEKRAVAALVDAYTAAFDAKDFQKFSGYCSDEMKFFTLDGQIFDRETMVPFLDRMMSRWQHLKTSIDGLEINASSRYGWARYQQIIRFSIAGQEGAMHNLISVGLVKENDSWRISHFHMSTSYIKNQ
ncbi:MAG: nuclear transport factor 2 family protein [Candidatus Zhuqueibacterota bacterium]